MPHYMLQFSYSQHSMKVMAESPQDRRTVSEEIVTAAGGKLVDFYFCFGDYDGIAIMELPSNVDAASVALAAGASGAFSKVKTTVLLTVEESLEVMTKTGKVDSHAGEGLV